MSGDAEGQADDPSLPPHELIYRQAMARIAAITEEWSAALRAMREEDGAPGRTPQGS